MFESMGGGGAQHPGGAPDRFHLTLYSGGRPVMHGYWRSEAVTRGKFRDWIGSGVSDARVVLADDETGETLDEWPAAVGARP